MNTEGSGPDTVLMCHAPIVLPQIAGSESAAVARTTAAMQEAADSLIGKAPDVVIVLSPHLPRIEQEYLAVAGRRLKGDFGRFGHPEITLELPVAEDARLLLEEHCKEEKVPFASAESERFRGLDHGTGVPLYFLTKSGWQGPTVVIGFPWSTRSRFNQALGRAIARAASQSDQKWSIVASGDMSHRLKPHAPAGFHPRAQSFDDQFRRQIEQGDIRAAVSADPDLRDLAAEDVIDSVEIAGATFGYKPQNSRVLSYEGPFGVGYLVSILNMPSL